MPIDYEQLEDWAQRVVQELQEVCDDAQIIAGRPFAEDQHPDLRALIKEHEQISTGQPCWRKQIELTKQLSPHAALKEHS